LAYLGNRPAESFASFEKQVFTIVNSQTAYTLSHSVTNENDIRLVVNSVVQEPGSGKAYTASGTTLTLSAALTNGTDTMYCVFLGRALQTVNAPNASVGSDQTAPTIITGQTAETSIATDDTILIHDTSASALRKMTRANFVSGIGGTNTPAFLATLSASQSVSTNTETKIQFNTELFDTANAYDNSTNYRFTIPSGKSGKYFIYCGYETGVSAANTDYNDIRLFKNGTLTYYSSMNSESINNAAFNRFPHKINIVDDCSVGDYFEVYARIGGSQATSPNIQGGSNRTFFGAYKIIE
jgi:hypothetical protein